MENLNELEVEKLKQEIIKIKVENSNSRIGFYSDLIKSFLLIIGGIILFIVIQQPESILNRKNSEETIARERAKLLLEIINYDKPEKIYQGITILKETYPNSNEWMSKIEKAIYKSAKLEISNDIINRYRELKEQQKCLELLLSAEMNGKIIESPCGYTSGLMGAGMRTFEIKKLLDNKIGELRELVKLYDLDEHTLPGK